MGATHQWQEVYDRLASDYDSQEWTHATVAEVDFLVDELSVPSGGSILDVGCGTGRHAIELARRGFRVTGVDISAGMLAQAAMAAERAEVEVDWVRGDAAHLTAQTQFDAAICLYDGALRLLALYEDPIDHDVAILEAIKAVVRPGGGVILVMGTGFDRIREFAAGALDPARFDSASMTDTYAIEWRAYGKSGCVLVKERHYVPSEAALLCRAAGLRVDHVWGAAVGRWGRGAVLPDDQHMMIVARRRVGPGLVSGMSLKRHLVAPEAVR